MIKLGDAKLFHVYIISKIDIVFIPMLINNKKVLGLKDSLYDIPDAIKVSIDEFYSTFDDDLILQEYKPNYPEKYVTAIFEILLK